MSRQQPDILAENALHMVQVSRNFSIPKHPRTEITGHISPFRLILRGMLHREIRLHRLIYLRGCTPNWGS